MQASLPAPPPGGVVLTGCHVGVSEPCSTLPPANDTLGALALVVVAWLLVVCVALLVLRAVVSESLDGEQDQGNDEVSGHVPS